MNVFNLYLEEDSMRAMKDSGIEWIGQIPKAWSIIPIQHCLKEINIKNNPIQTTEVLSLIKDKGVIPYNEKGDQGNKAKENYTEYHLAYPNTIVLNCMNILIGSVGISKYFGCVSPVYYVFKETDKSNLRFINYIFNTKEFQKELRKYAKGILEIRLRVSSNDIFKRNIPLPLKKEQTTIVNYLDKKCSEIDFLTSDIKLQIEKMEEYKKSIITEAVIKGLDTDVEMKDSGIEWIGEIPNTWNCSKLNYECYIRARLGWKGLKADEYVDEGYAFLSAFNIQENKMMWNNINYINKQRYDESPEIKLSIGDVLLVKDGAGIGKTARIDELPMGECTTNSSLAVITPFKNLNYKYLSYYFQSSIFFNFINRVLNGMGVPHLTQEIMKSIYILLPTYDEQLKIVDFLDNKCNEIDNTIKLKRQQLSKLEEYKKSLIYEYVTGKKEVT